MQSQLRVSETKETSKVQVLQKQHYKKLNVLEISIREHEGKQNSDLYEIQVLPVSENRYRF